MGGAVGVTKPAAGAAAPATETGLSGVAWVVWIAADALARAATSICMAESCGLGEGGALDLALTAAGCSERAPALGELGADADGLGRELALIDSGARPVPVVAAPATPRDAAAAATAAAAIEV